MACPSSCLRSATLRVLARPRLSPLMPCPPPLCDPQLIASPCLPVLWSPATLQQVGRSLGSPQGALRFAPPDWLPSRQFEPITPGLRSRSSTPRSRWFAQGRFSSLSSPAFCPSFSHAWPAHSLPSQRCVFDHALPGRQASISWVEILGPPHCAF